METKEQELIRKSYETIKAILEQWEEKKLDSFFFKTPYELNELLSELSQ